MGAALLAAHAAASPGAGRDLEVESAGFGATGIPAVPEVVAAMADIGIDLSAHRSLRVTRQMCRESDLIVGMTRQHVVDLAVLDQEAWPRTWPLVDLVRRGRRLGRRSPGEAPAAWMRRAHEGRRASDVLSLPESDDVADPIGEPFAAYEKTRDQLASLFDDLIALLALDRDDDRANESSQSLTWSGWGS